jgi:regulator of protease activity HflC (stomatin/prohibitin superfamily)
VEIVIAALVAIVFVLLAGRALLTAVTVFEYQRGLKFVDGQFTVLLVPGRYWVWQASQEIRLVDTRESILPVPGQEVVSSDGVSVKLSLAVRYRVADPVVAITQVENYHGATYLLLQVALREVVAELTIDEILERRQSIGPSVQERCVGSAAELGVELLSVQVKDLMFPGPLKKVFAQVTEARQQGLAAVEKARGDTAALRGLANAARLVDANPALLHLRTLQQLSASSGNTLIVGLPPGSTPVPVSGQPGTEPRLETGAEPREEPAEG